MSMLKEEFALPLVVIGHFLLTVPLIILASLAVIGCVVIVTNALT